MTETRKLAAILAADIVGFSRLAGSDEDRTLARLRALRSDLIDPTIAVHHGRVVKRTGDGVLVEYRSVVDAVRCAIEVQNGMAERNAGLPPERRIDFRIGIHLGDIVEESDGDWMGDGVNIAARLEGIAKPGAICLSEDAYRQVKARLNLAVSDLGATQLKNIPEPIRVYSLEVSGVVQTKPETQGEPAVPENSSIGLALPDKPSIAVLAFQNMSGDPEQEYFADGVVEDIITALSRFKNMFVIARNSSFTYKGRAIDVKQVGRELGVRYVLEGSVRKAGQQMRITAQLIDAASGAHLWAERFDGSISDIFDLQDQVTASVVGSITPKLEQAEIERVKYKPTESLDAYDHFLRGMAFFHQQTKTSLNEALRHFNQAIAADRDFAIAYGMAAWCLGFRRANGWTDDRVSETAEAVRFGSRAVELARDDAIALSTGGWALAYLGGDLAASADPLNRARLINPNLATAWQLCGWVNNYLGETDQAIEHFKRAMRLSPFDPLNYTMQSGMAMAHFQAGEYAEAILWASKAMSAQPSFLSALRTAVAGNALLGRQNEAEKYLARLREVDPALRMGNYWERLPTTYQPSYRARMEEGMRKAGLPE
jgi:adenylate cyclase